MRVFEHGIRLGQWNGILARVTLVRILDDNAELGTSVLIALSREFLFPEQTIREKI